MSFFDCLWTALNTQLVSSIVGAAASIGGVYWAIWDDRQKRLRERKQAIKPVIFGEFGESKLTVNDLSEDARSVFPIFSSNQFSKGLFGIRQSFKLTVQGDNPAKNLKLEEFGLSEEDERLLNFGQTLKGHPVFGNDTHEYHNFDFIQKKDKRVYFNKPPFHVLAGRERDFDVDFVSYKVEKTAFYKIFGDILNNNGQILLHKLASDLVPVQATFSYEDIDGNRYKDLVINFYIGLKLYSDNEFEYVSFFVTDETPELSSDGTLVYDFIEYTTPQPPKNHSNHENREGSIKKENQ